MSATDHRNFLSSLGAERLAALAERSDAAGLGHLAGHLAAIGVTGTAIALGPPGWWLALPVHGVLLTFLFCLEHEATHGTPFASRWLNTAAGHACGLVLGLPFGWFRLFHMAHHRWTNDPGRDPELLAGGHPRTRAAWAWHVSGLPYWAAMARVLVANAAGRGTEPFVPDRARPRLMREARAMLAVYAALLASLWWSSAALWLWLLPMILGQPVLRLYLLAEHGRCPQVADMLANTRTTFTTRAVRFLAWNMPYHTEHHVLPNVPFHRLPEAHRLMAAQLKVTAPGYTAFTRDYLAGLRR